MKSLEHTHSSNLSRKWREQSRKKLKLFKRPLEETFNIVGVCVAVASTAAGFLELKSKAAVIFLWSYK